MRARLLHGPDPGDLGCSTERRAVDMIQPACLAPSPLYSTPIGAKSMRLGARGRGVDSGTVYKAVNRVGGVGSSGSTRQSTGWVGWGAGTGCWGPCGMERCGGLEGGRGACTCTCTDLDMRLTEGALGGTCTCTGLDMRLTEGALGGTRRDPGFTLV